MVLEEKYCRAIEDLERCITDYQEFAIETSAAIDLDDALIELESWRLIVTTHPRSSLDDRFAEDTETSSLIELALDEAVAICVGLRRSSEHDASGDTDLDFTGATRSLLEIVESLSAITDHSSKTPDQEWQDDQLQNIMRQHERRDLSTSIFTSPSTPYETGNMHEKGPLAHVASLSHSANKDAAEAALASRLLRKRTKIGCLTCRKRRIKCGEEHPVCKNCIKSKRLCEGYNQRVIFKPPTFDYRVTPNGGAHITFQPDQVGAPLATKPHTQMPQYMLDGTPYAALQPQTIAQYVPQIVHLHGQHYVIPQQAQHVPQDVPSHPPNLQPVPVEQHVAMPYHAQLQAMQQYHGSQQYPATFEQMIARADHVQSSGQHPVQPQLGDVTTDVQQRSNHLPQPAADASANLRWSGNASSTAQNVPVSAPLPMSFSERPAHLRQTPVEFSDSQSWTLPTYTPRPELSRPIDQYQALPADEKVYQQPTASEALLNSAFTTQMEHYNHEHIFLAAPAPADLINDAAVETQDDDYFDVESDEEMDVEQAFAIAKDTPRERTLDTILMRQHFDDQNMQMRRYDTFIQSGMLDHYRVEQVANPLKNPATARVFAHFISATGPSLTTFDRHSVSSSVLFTQGAVPVSQQGLWTYILPMKALHHQGLLHAMLAMSSLHIARLEGASVTPSMQHYAWALKHIHKCVASPNEKKRLAVTTIAASMLLGFYEIFTADHMKWNTHLMGAKQLFVETDFASMARQFRKMKRDKAAMERVYGRRNSFSMQLNGIFHDDGLDQVNDVDDNVISQLVGREVRYDQQGHIEDPHAHGSRELNLKKFEILKDLYWWYCKQDAYQSIVSGNPLLLDFSRWTDCPPRAPLGRSDAVYGCSDHLMLILGRIADFASKDRERKLKQMEANGGQWRPAPGMKMPGPPKPPPDAAVPNGFDGRMRQGPPPGESPAQPAFYGMAPPPSSNAQMPASYRVRDQAQMPRAAHTSGPMDLQAATQAALEEYDRIRAALKAFADALSGEAFQPLAADLQPPLLTPFGPALFYRSYDIGCLWSIYNMCVIIAIRSHPHMHPAAHVAAALAAQETASYANAIGRIAAGIVPGPANQPLDPSLGSALRDSCMPSFFAAIQYQRPDERHETVMRIYGIALRTGWGSAELMANGCETSWVKAAEAGRGPPYHRVVKPRTSDDPRLNGKWEKLDMALDPDEEDLEDRRYIKRKLMSRLQWAIGIMGTEGDIPEIS